MPHEGSSLLQKLPSQYIAELAEPQTHAEGWRPKPQVVESLNLADYTHQARCCGCVQNNPGLHASVCEGMGGCLPELDMWHGAALVAVTAQCCLRTLLTAERP